MLVAVLIILNIPVFLFIAWLAFDSKDNAADTFFETIVALLKLIFVPRIIRVLIWQEEEGAWGIFPIAGFFLACAGIVYGEHYLLVKYVFTGS